MIKTNYLSVFVATLLLAGCASIPRETILLSQTIGHDLNSLHQAHLQLADIHFRKIENEINVFVDEVYAPFVINFVLKSEFRNYQAGSPSLYGAIENAGTNEGETASQEAIDMMLAFQEAARVQIESKRDELLQPIRNQHLDISREINQSYANVTYANASITAYLQSLHKLKDARQEGLSMIGLDGLDIRFSDSLVKLSQHVEMAVKAGKKIDIQSDGAFMELETISDQIKELTTKN
jgi:hypothetical protein